MPKVDYLGNNMSDKLIMDSYVFPLQHYVCQKCIAINRTDRMPDKFAGSRQNRLLREEN